MVTMVVQVRLFAMLRERAGRDRVEVQLADGATVRDALEAVGAEHGLGELIAAMPVLMAVNREYAADGDTLSAGDELALIPPVSGGELQRFETGPGYERFMDLVGNHVPRPPAYAELLGMRPLHAEPGRIQLEFNATEQFLNPAGSVQGGFLAVMLDEAMGPAALSVLGPGFMIPTLEFKVSFIRPGRPGRMVADAHVVHRGKSVVFLESSLSDEQGTLLATATATARIVRFDKDGAG
jgi:molybdopterin converting factor subunit 1